MEYTNIKYGGNIKMLELIKKLNYKEKLLKGSFGIERETLRVTKKGDLALTKHPRAFGSKISNPYITTDFSESQIELITPPLSTVDEAHNFLTALYDMTVLELDNEYLWPQSMPCNIPEEDKIPVAEYAIEDDYKGENASNYRKHLLKKYGGKKQLISGIHFNFSFNENLIKDLYKLTEDKREYRDFRDHIYLKVVRNYLRYRWLLIYLLGGTAVMHESFGDKCLIQLNKINEGSFSNEGAISYRNSECGYKNPIDLYPNYNSVKEYVESVNKFIDDKVIDSHKELYTQIRLKAYDNDNFLDSLLAEGINYLEMRSIDINPFDKAGISKEDLNFIVSFLIYLLVKEESGFENWQEEAQYNQNIIALYGQKDVALYKDGEEVSKNKWAVDILEEMKEILKVLSIDKDRVMDNMISRVKDPSLTYAAKISEIVKKEGFLEGHMNLSIEYRDDAFNNRYKFQGYEDLELSTQILMKEAIKRGIKAEIIDRSENFIALTKDNHTEYIKQATKTSMDNYATVLIMENKTITKKILEKNNIKVPRGFEFSSLKEAIENINEFKDHPIVIKPKSTNFGIGVSIFKDKVREKTIINALERAFKHDNAVLVEEFIQGKEYRFLVIGDKVAGILHRVPANIVGNANNTIQELVEIKNLNPLRGKGYKKPLEKIELDEEVKTFLREKGMTINYVPNKNEIVYLRENSNISTGGDSIDYTDLIPEKFKKIAIESAKAVGASICGVDMIIEDYTRFNSNYAIIELNFNPAIHIHSYPYEGKERKIAEEVLALLGLI